MAEFPMKTEVVVIGAGVAGSMTAYFLAKKGIPVIVCEKGRVAGEQSSRNWGYIRKQGRDPRELPAIIESLRAWENMEADIGDDIGKQQRRGAPSLGCGAALGAGPASRCVAGALLLRVLWSLELPLAARALVPRAAYAREPGAETCHMCSL